MFRSVLIGCALGIVVLSIGCSAKSSDGANVATQPAETPEPPVSEFFSTPGGVKQLLSTVGAPLSRKGWDEITTLVEDIERLAHEVARRQNGARSMKKRAEFIEKMGAKRRTRAAPEEEREMITALQGRAKLLEGEADDLSRDLVAKQDRMRAIVRFDLRRNGFRAKFSERGQLEGYERSVDS